MTNLAWDRHDIFITQDTEVTFVTEMNLQAEIYIVCKKPIKHSCSVPERRELPSLKSETTKMLHEKNKTLKKTKCRWCRFLFFKGRSQCWVCRTASGTDPAGRPARGPISASCDVELGPLRTKAPPRSLGRGHWKGRQMSIAFHHSCGPWEGGVVGGLAGIWTTLWPLPQLFTRAPTALMRQAPPEAFLDVEPSG